MKFLLQRARSGRETEKAVLVELIIGRPDGEEREYDFWFPKSLLELVQEQILLPERNVWLVKKKLEEWMAKTGVNWYPITILKNTEGGHVLIN